MRNAVRAYTLVTTLVKGAASVLKTEQAKIDLDDVEDVFDDMEELMQDMDDIGEVMGRSYGLGEDVNEADLDAELAGLEDEFDSFEMEGEEAAAPAPADYLPSAPSAEPEAGLDLPPAAPVEAAPVYVHKLSDHQVQKKSAHSAPSGNMLLSGVRVSCPPHRVMGQLFFAGVSWGVFVEIFNKN